MLILARRRGAKPNAPREIVSGPSLDFATVKAQFNNLCLDRNNPDFEEVELGSFVGERRQRLPASDAQKPQPFKKKKNENAS